MKSWEDMLREEATMRGEDIDHLVFSISKEELCRKFNTGYGSSEGAPFTAWGSGWVYFPVVYDGAEWVGSVPRHPCQISTEHVGGQ